MSFLNKDTLDQLLYERSKTWTSIFDNYTSDEPEAVLDITAGYDWGERYFDTNDNARESSLEAEEVDVPHDSKFQDSVIVSQRSAVGKTCLQVVRAHDNTVSFALDKEDIDLLNQTQSLLEEQNRRWEAAGIFKILNTFEMRNIKKVGNWIKNQCERKRSETLRRCSDSDSDSVHSPCPPRKNCHRPRVYSAVKTTVRKKYVILHGNGGQHPCCGNSIDFSDSSPEAKARQRKWHYADCNNCYGSNTNKVMKKKQCSCQRRHQLSQLSSSSAISSLLELLGNDPRLAKQVCEKLRPEKSWYQRRRHTIGESSSDDSFAEITYQPRSNNNAPQMMPKASAVDCVQFKNLTISEMKPKESREFQDAKKDAQAENKPNENRDRAKETNGVHAVKKLQLSNECAASVEQAECKPKESGDRTKLLIKEVGVEEAPKKGRAAKTSERAKQIKETKGQKWTEAVEHAKVQNHSHHNGSAKKSDVQVKETKEPHVVPASKSNDLAHGNWSQPQSGTKATKKMEGTSVKERKSESREMESKLTKSAARSGDTKKIEVQNKPKDSSESSKTMQETQGKQNPKASLKDAAHTTDEARENRARAKQQERFVSKEPKAKKEKKKANVKKNKKIESGEEQTFNDELKLALKISSELYESERRLRAMMIKENRIAANPNANQTGTVASGAASCDPGQKQTEPPKPKEVTPTAPGHGNSQFAFKKPQPVLPKLKKLTGREDTFLKDSANMCNSTALANDSAAVREFSDKTPNETAPQTQKGQSYAQALSSIKTSEREGAKSLPQQADAERCHVTSQDGRRKAQPILVYKPDDRKHLPEQSFVDEKFILTETHLSTIIGAAKAKRVFKQWNGRRMFDASNTLFYREGEENDDSSSDSDEDPLESFNKVGKIYQVPSASGWDIIYK